jgi:dimethylargininase
VLRNEGDRLTRAIVSSPDTAYFDLATHGANNIPELADRTRAQRQHARLVAMLAAGGAEVINLPELEGHPNSVFTRDAALCTPNGHIVLRMGLDARRGEERWLSKALEGLGEPYVGTIEDPGTVEGGDVILAGAVAFVGISGRTNSEGARQLRGMLEEMEFEVRTITVPERHLHLGGMMSAIAPRRLLCCDAGVPAEALEDFDVVAVPFRGPSTGNVICLGPNEVIANVAENAEAISVLERSGVVAHSVDLSEFRKGAGGPTCLLLPVERR